MSDVDPNPPAIELLRRLDRRAAATERIEDHIEHIKRWVRELAEKRAMHQHATTLAIGARLTDYKSEMETLAARMPELVKKWLDQDQYWSHRSGFAAANTKEELWDYRQPSQHSSTERSPGAIDIVIKSSITRAINEVLAKYGYSQIAEHSNPAYPGWPLEMRSAYEPYVQARANMSEVWKERADATENKSKLAARLAWKKA